MLATIQKIIDVKPIENSDFLDVVKVLGWQVVTRKGDFSIGDLCIYIGLDTIVPNDNPNFSFLEKDHFRIKTKKLRGCLSQGIIFPLSIIPNELEKTVGMDVSEILGITHYEKPIPVSLRGVVRGNFPPHIPKTDENRIQNYVDVLNELKGVQVYSTVKCNGTSITISINNGDFHICSRNNSFKIEENKENVYVKTALKYGLDKKLVDYKRNIAIQGELVGPGIQKNQMGLSDYKILVFNIYFIDRARYADYAEVLSICKDLELEVVPFIETFRFNHTIEQLLEMTKGYYSGTKNFREGIVIRPLHEMFSTVMRGRMSFKVLNNMYLLKEKE